MVLNLLLYYFLHGKCVTELWDINVFILSVFDDSPTFVFIVSFLINNYIVTRLMWSIHLNTRMGINCAVVLKASKSAVTQVFLHAPSKNSLNIKMIAAWLILSITYILLAFFNLLFMKMRVLLIYLFEYLLRLLIDHIFLLIQKALLDFKKNIIASHSLLKWSLFILYFTLHILSVCIYVLLYFRLKTFKLLCKFII